MKQPDPDSSSIELDGADDLRKRAGIWGAVGIACWLVHPLSSALFSLVIIAGIAAGGLNAWWISRLRVSRLRVSRIERTRLATVVVVIAVMMLSGPPQGFVGSLAAGALLSAIIDVITLLFAKRALKRFNEALNFQASFKPPPELDADGTRRAFVEALPQPLREEMAKTFVEVTVIEPQPPSDELPPLCSSLGGSPLLEPNVAWPEHNHVPLDFLCQINLSEAAEFLPVGVPRSGLLAFFFSPEQPWGDDAEDRGSSRIVFSPAPDSCVSFPHPSGTIPKMRQGLRFRKEIVQSVPDDLNERFYQHFRALKGTARQQLDALHDRVFELNRDDSRLFCVPAPVQNQMSDDLEKAAVFLGLSPDTEWSMALQLESVHEQDWCWGDAGCIYFWVPKNDIEAGRFDRAWVILQCT